MDFKKTRKKEIKIKKGETTNKLIILRDLMRDMDDLFESIEDEEADNTRKFFGASNKTVSAKDFKLTFIIEENK